jgi:hypothetical protein
MVSLGVLFVASARKVYRERGWSTGMIVVFSISLVIGMVIPSIGYGLQLGLQSYMNTVFTYVVVANAGGCNEPGLDYCLNITTSLINNISSIRDIQNVYPVAVNQTDIIQLIAFNGSTVKDYHDFDSVVMGGPNGLPPDMVTTLCSKIIGNSGFLLDSALINQLPPSNNSLYTVCINCYPTGMQPFNASLEGTCAESSLLTNVDLIWNATFLQNVLGGESYRSSFDNSGFVLVKVDNVRNVEGVVKTLAGSLGQFGLTPIYDQANLLNAQSLESNLALPYTIIGGAAIAAGGLLMILVSYISTVRRRWESGLLETQGWSRKEIFRFQTVYLLLLSCASFTISMAFSFVVLPFLSTNLAIYGQIIAIKPSTNDLFYLIGLIFSVAVPFASSFLSYLSAGKHSLDQTLREN